MAANILLMTALTAHALEGNVLDVASGSAVVLLAGIVDISPCRDMGGAM